MTSTPRKDTRTMHRNLAVKLATGGLAAAGLLGAMAGVASANEGGGHSCSDPEGSNGDTAYSGLLTCENGTWTWTGSSQVGPQGPTGATGATGPQGPQGATGAQGSPGAEGASGLQGPAGATGAQGAAGENGAAGSNGTNGTDGKNGTNGTNGASGVAGTTTVLMDPSPYAQLEVQRVMPTRHGKDFVFQVDAANVSGAELLVSYWRVEKHGYVEIGTSTEALTGTAPRLLSGSIYVPKGEAIKVRAEHPYSNTITKIG